MGDRLYSESHEWITVEAGVATVGISDFAQAQLGDVVFLDLPQVGRQVKRGETFGVIESVKAASDLYAPADGEVVEVNEKLGAEPELVNTEPYAGGWIMRVRLSGDVPGDLMDESSYAAHAAAGH